MKQCVLRLCSCMGFQLVQKSMILIEFTWSKRISSHCYITSQYLYTVKVTLLGHNGRLMSVVLIYLFYQRETLHFTLWLVCQLFKGMMYHCEGVDVKDVDTKIDCINKGLGYLWVNQKYNFDNLGQVHVKSPVLLVTLQLVCAALRHKGHYTLSRKRWEIRCLANRGRVGNLPSCGLSDGSWMFLNRPTSRSQNLHIKYIIYLLEQCILVGPLWLTE